jgi:hypothetical protein
MTRFFGSRSLKLALPSTHVVRRTKKAAEKLAFINDSPSSGRPKRQRVGERADIERVPRKVGFDVPTGAFPRLESSM